MTGSSRRATIFEADLSCRNRLGMSGPRAWEREEKDSKGKETVGFVPFGLQFRDFSEAG